MGGAYVAKPALIVPLVIPPGWNPDWTFPGPSPPGYTPQYSVQITAPSSLSPDAAMGVSATLYDQISYKTNQPDAASLIAWSATIDGSPVLLRFDGVGDYEVSVDSTYIRNAGFWGASPTLDVQLTSEHSGKTLVLSAQSTIRGQTVNATEEILVGASYRIEVKITGASLTTIGPGHAEAFFTVGIDTIHQGEFAPPSGFSGYGIYSYLPPQVWWSYAGDAIASVNANSATAVVFHTRGSDSVEVFVRLYCCAGYDRSANSLAAGTCSFEIEIKNVSTEEVVYSNHGSYNVMAIYTYPDFFMVEDEDDIALRFYPDTEEVEYFEQ